MICLNLSTQYQEVETADKEPKRKKLWVLAWLETKPEISSSQKIKPPHKLNRIWFCDWEKVKTMDSISLLLKNFCTPERKYENV